MIARFAGYIGIILGGIFALWRAVVGLYRLGQQWEASRDAALQVAQLATLAERIHERQLDILSRLDGVQGRLTRIEAVCPPVRMQDGAYHDPRHHHEHGDTDD